MVLIRKNGFWRVYATRWVGLGLWGRCVSYVRENCVSYARQQIWYHMHTKTAFYMHTKHVRIRYTPKSIFAYQYQEFSFLFGVLLIRIFMRPGTIFCVSSTKRPMQRNDVKQTVHLSPRSLVFSRFTLNMASSLTEAHTKPRIQTSRRQK